MRLIDADALIRHICGSRCGCEMGECGYTLPCQYVGYIQDAPTIEPEPHWIPVEERLPEDGVYVLICDGEHFKDYDCKNGAYSQIAVGWTEQGEFRCWDDRTHMSRVIAWMPLPEPFKGGDADDD